MARESGKSGAQFVQYFGPLLNALRSLGGSSTPQEAVDRIACDLQLTDELLNETLPSGELRFRNQVHWARFYLAREGLLDSSKRGVWTLSEDGRHTHLTDSDARNLFLKWVKRDQKGRKTKRSAIDEASTASNLNPSELIDEEAEADLLSILRSLSPEGFEHFCKRLLRESGFSEVHVTGKVGDDGIDGYGTLEINALVSFKVLFQCKRYKGSVGAPAIRDFRGAMLGRADKGIILTTGTFTADAKREANRDGVPPVELIDGLKLVSLMENLELGVRPRTIFEPDHKFFEQFRNGVQN